MKLYVIPKYQPNKEHNPSTQDCDVVDEYGQLVAHFETMELAENVAMQYNRKEQNPLIKRGLEDLAQQGSVRQGLYDNPFA